MRRPSPSPGGRNAPYAGQDTQQEAKAGPTNRRPRDWITDAGGSPADPASGDGLPFGRDAAVAIPAEVITSPGGRPVP